MFSFTNIDSEIKAVMYEGKFVGNLEDIDGVINFKGTGMGALYRTEIIRKYKKEFKQHETTQIIKKVQ